eukprot:6210820-Pleurochrysis_carterae.AAC.2
MLLPSRASALRVRACERARVRVCVCVSPSQLAGQAPSNALVSVRLPPCLRVHGNHAAARLGTLACIHRRGHQLWHLQRVDAFCPQVHANVKVYWKKTACLNSTISPKLVKVGHLNIAIPARRASCCVSLRCNLRIKLNPGWSWWVELTLPKTTLYLPTSRRY